MRLRDLADVASDSEVTGFALDHRNVAPVVSGTISRIAPMLGVQPDMNREPDMSQVLPFVHETRE